VCGGLGPISYVLSFPNVPARVCAEWSGPILISFGFSLDLTRRREDAEKTNPYFLFFSSLRSSRLRVRKSFLLFIPNVPLRQSPLRAIA
jgi:hypothetical protein